MAKKYIRINFEDRPSTRSPIDAANLNKIDAAVDELDTWRDGLIVDNAASALPDKAWSANQGKIITDKVTALNESLSNKEITFTLHPNVKLGLNSGKAWVFGKTLFFSAYIEVSGTIEQYNTNFIVFNNLPSNIKITNGYALTRLDGNGVVLIFTSSNGNRLSPQGVIVAGSYIINGCCPLV